MTQDRGREISLTGQRMTSVRVPLMCGNFPKKIQSDTSHCTGLSGAPIIHENAKKYPGAHSLRSLVQCSMIRSEISCGKTELSLDLRIQLFVSGEPPSRPLQTVFHPDPHWMLRALQALRNFGRFSIQASSGYFCSHISVCQTTRDIRSHWHVLCDQARDHCRYLRTRATG
jgi:hypothetical protein